MIVPHGLPSPREMRAIVAATVPPIAILMRGHIAGVAYRTVVFVPIGCGLAAGNAIGESAANDAMNVRRENVKGMLPIGTETRE